MLQVKLDRVDGAELRRSVSGDQAVRIAQVSGLTGSGADRLRQALEAPGLPRLGDVHPTLSHLTLAEVAAEADGPDGAVLRLRYQATASRSVSVGGAPRQTGERRVGAALAQTSTDVDLTGQRIEVAYDPHGNRAQRLTQSASVTVLRPQLSFCFRRQERSDPAARARKYVGAVNSQPFQQCAAQTLLCVALTGQSSDGGRSYDVTYEFQYDAQGWQPRVSYTDPQTRRPPVDVLEGLGRKVVTVYPQIDFNELGL